MRLSIKIPGLLIGSITLLTLALAFFLYYAQIALIEKSKNRELMMVAKVVQNSLQNRADNSLARASFMGNLPPVRDYFKEGNRDKLTELLLPAVKEQYNRYGLRSTSFFHPPASTFLIMFDLNRKAGEDVSSYREMLTTASRRQEAQKGIEIGRSGMSLRGVFPIKDNDTLIGILDVGMDFSDIVNDIKRTTGYEVGVFVDEALMKKVAVNAPIPEPDHIVGDMRNIQATDWGQIKGVLPPGLLSRVKDTETITTQMNGVDYGLLGIPLNDFSGRQIGVLLAVRSFADFQNQANQALLNVVLFAVLQMVIMSGIALVVTRGMMLRPLDSLMKALEDLGKDAKSEDMEVELDEALAKRSDEIGRLAKGVEGVKEKLAQADKVSRGSE